MKKSILRSIGVGTASCMMTGVCGFAASQASAAPAAPLTVVTKVAPRVSSGAPTDVASCVAATASEVVTAGKGFKFVKLISTRVAVKTAAKRLPEAVGKKAAEQVFRELISDKKLIQSLAPTREDVVIFTITTGAALVGGWVPVVVGAVIVKAKCFPAPAYQKTHKKGHQENGLLGLLLKNGGIGTTGAPTGAAQTPPTSTTGAPTGATTTSPNGV
ncbi:hypothetical protein, partial [Streptomyces avermitilis]|uniref:hypothetical protein n=1 Tax=Streptomyces avermitilis TaxID=33903 RepID=UPI0033A53035